MLNLLYPLYYITWKSNCVWKVMSIFAPLVFQLYSLLQSKVQYIHLWNLTLFGILEKTKQNNNYVRLIQPIGQGLQPTWIVKVSSFSTIKQDPEW